MSGDESAVRHNKSSHDRAIRICDREYARINI
jgi:hypothetical protein